MYNFNMSIPTQIYFGDEIESKAGSLMRLYGQRILLIYGSDRIFEEGLGGRLVCSLQEAGCTVFRCGGVKPNADIAYIEKAIKVARMEKIDGILAVGGGSAIDSAKAVSAGSAYGGSVLELYEKPEIEPETFLPIGAVVTIPATASESNDMSVISDGLTGKKIARSFKETRPKFALLNPSLTLSVNGFQTASGGFDIFSHAFERFFDLTRNSCLLDGLTESLMRTVIDVLPKVLQNPADLALRSELMLAATIAHNDMLGPGGDFACHEISHVITEKYGIAHGSALAMILPAWCSQMSKRNPKRFCQFFQNVWGVEGKEQEQVIAQGLQKMKTFVNGIGLPLNISLGAGSLDELVRTIGTPGGNFTQLTEAEVRAILEQIVA